ncbi:PucR family transcriptional regulator [Amycolatopsis pigmentata]|uniref:PucR family transcriptional regulator n=1 Tax=Amycolatopsis pigmentata TaxID=450801 RepID=A0ABW5G695_9PSEU
MADNEISRENTALRGLVAVYRHLSTLAAQDSGIEAVTELIAERMDATVAVVDERMGVLAAASPAGVAEEVVRERVVHPRLAQVLALTGHTRRAARIPDVIEPSPMIVAPIPVGNEVPAFLLTLHDGEGDIGDDMRLLVTEHAATVCGVILGRERVVAAAGARAREDLIEGLLSGKGSDADEVLRWARHLGYDETRDHRVLALVVEQSQDGLGERAPVVIERFFGTQASDAIIAVRDREVVVVLPSDTPRADQADRAERLTNACLDRVRELFPSALVTVGIGGRCGPPEQIATSYDEARRTVETARRMGRTGTVVAFDELGIHRLLLQVADPAQLRAFAHEVFGELSTHPRAAVSEYLTTLGCYFRANNSPQRASRALHVHPNTVTYRVRRVEQITALDFTNYRDRLMAQVALEILDAVGEGP